MLQPGLSWFELEFNNFFSQVFSAQNNHSFAHLTKYIIKKSKYYSFLQLRKDVFYSNPQVLCFRNETMFLQNMKV